MRRPVLQYPILDVSIFFNLFSQSLPYILFTNEMCIYLL